MVETYQDGNSNFCLMSANSVNVYTSRKMYMIDRDNGDMVEEMCVFDDLINAYSDRAFATKTTKTSFFCPSEVSDR